CRRVPRIPRLVRAGAGVDDDPPAGVPACVVDLAGNDVEPGAVVEADDRCNRTGVGRSPPAFAARGAAPGSDCVSARFAGRVALVAGGTGALGRAVSRALLEEGAHV